MFRSREGKILVAGSQVRVVHKNDAPGAAEVIPQRREPLHFFLRPCLRSLHCSLDNPYMYRLLILTLFSTIVICMIVLASFQRALADKPVSAEVVPNSLKLYSPFDEHKPRIPAEILSDKRLDTSITVLVKSKNMKNLFSEIRRQTGVKIVAARELLGERPIIFFLDKPLRDVMTEISALYGYYWLAKGQKNAWTYELFEDVVHSKRRVEVRDSQEAAKVESLLDCIDLCSKALESDDALERFRQTNPRLYRSVADPALRELLKLIMLHDRATIRGLVNDVGMVRKYADLPPEMQSSVLKIINAALGKGDDPTFEPWRADQMQSAIITLKRWRADLFAPPHIIIVVAVPATKADGTGGMRFFTEWPAYDEGEPGMLSMPTAPPGKVIGEPLPSGTKITVEQNRKQLYSGAILVGDVLDAIARQANLNVIADYYFQETALPACSNEPLDKLVSEICLKMDYTCQVEKNTLRFRFNNWFLQALPEEPPSSLQEHWWRRITETGGLSFDDLLDIACLPDRQTFWGGFRFIPQAWQARRFPRTARVVQMLDSVLEAEACTPAGLSVSRLNADQFSRIADWAGVMGIKETPEGLLKCTIRIEKSGNPVNSLQFLLVLPDGTPRGVPMTASMERLDENQRRTLAAERAAELAADKVELSLPSGK